MKAKFQQYLYKLLELNGSDLHLKAGSSVHMRVNGELLTIKDEKLNNEDLLRIAEIILSTPQYNTLMENKELDCSYNLEKHKRFRVNFFYQVNGLSVVLRVIPEKILSIDELKLPEIVKKLADLNHGLVLVTGTSGSGKSTTLAAIIDRINKRKRKHIISIEDPVEYLHNEDKCLISQRSVGTTTHSFANGLRAALREDIDIIFIGELRDFETVEIALHAANTGHLVVSTLHTLDAKETISRILGMFPKEEQARVRMTLSFLLEGVVSQRLVMTKDKKRVPAVEVMMKTKRISELIAENRDDEILESIAKGKEVYGSQSFDQSLFELYSQNKIGKSVVLRNATNPSDMSLMLQGIRQASGHENRESIGKPIRSAFDLK
jgi:twitching motility protein PilT